MAKRRWKQGLILGLIFGAIVSFLYSIPSYILLQSSNLFVLVLFKLYYLFYLNPIYWFEFQTCHQSGCGIITIITTPIFYGIYGLLIGLIFKRKK